VPTEQGTVFKIVGTTYDQVVKDTSKDVFVKYYAPWCNHCKQLEPIWEELAQKVAHIDDLVIAKFDATENEVEGLTPVNNFPQLRLFTKQDKQGILFDEKERTLP
jgi:thiol-disulfide isomerase/thioredoxin